MTNPERLTPDEAADLVEDIVNGVRQANRLEGMWNPNYYDPEIHLSDGELAEFIATFAQNEQGQRIEAWVKAGAKCEARREEPHTTTAQASIDWIGVTVSDSVLVCLEDLRPTYRVLTEDGRRQGLNPTLTINGKEIPRMPAEESMPPSPAPEI